MNTQEKSRKLCELRQKLGEMESAYKVMAEPLKQERDALQVEVLESLRQEGQFSARYDFATITRAVRKVPVIESEQKVIGWLKKNKLAKEYTAIRLTESFDALAKEVIKEGKAIDGMEIKETEYLSITIAKEGDKRKIAMD